MPIMNKLEYDKKRRAAINSMSKEEYYNALQYCRDAMARINKEIKTLKKRMAKK